MRLRKRRYTAAELFAQREAAYREAKRFADGHDRRAEQAVEGLEGIADGLCLECGLKARRALERLGR